MSSPAERSTGTVYQQVQSSPEFRAFRSRLRRYVFPMTVIFLAWYLAFVLLASYAPEFMSIRVSGMITVGLLVVRARGVRAAHPEHDDERGQHEQREEPDVRGDTTPAGTRSPGRRTAPLIGLGQFVSTFLITTLYVRFAERELDGPSAELRARVEGGRA